MKLVITSILYLISLVAVMTGLNVIIFGAAAIPGSAGAVEATVDNELRFFAVFWLAYGGFSFWVAKNIVEQYHFIPSIALIFFLGGVARLISMLTIGSPASILIPAMFLEFFIPVVIFILYRKVYKQKLTMV